MEKPENKESLLLAARHPFISGFKETVVSMDIVPDINELLTSDAYLDIRERAAARLEKVIEEKSIPADTITSIDDARDYVLMEIYTRILISGLLFLTDYEPLKKWYGKARAELCWHFIGDMYDVSGINDKGSYRKVFRSLGIDLSPFTKEKDKMSLRDYLRIFSSSIEGRSEKAERKKSEELKLVNQELINGDVAYNRIQNESIFISRASAEFREKSSGPVNDKILELCKDDLQRLRVILEKKIESLVKQYGVVEEAFPPCFSAVLDSYIHGINIGHSARFFMVTFLHQTGMDLDRILEVFSRSPYFESSKSMYQIRHIIGDSYGKEYIVPGCDKLLTEGVCVYDILKRQEAGGKSSGSFEMDKYLSDKKSSMFPICRRVEHPFTYYIHRIRAIKGSEKKETQEE